MLTTRRTQRTMAAVLIAALLTITACCRLDDTTQTVTPDAENAPTISIECRVMIVPDNFFDNMGFEYHGPDLRKPPVILDNLTVNALIRSTQADARTITIDAPRIVIADGQEGRIICEETYGFVEGKEENKVYSFAVKPTISADHRYVELRVHDLKICTSTATKPTITARVPDGGMVLLDIVPVEDNRLALFLVRPKIIIQKEIETNLFGPDYDKPTGLPNPNIGSGFYNKPDRPQLQR